MYNPIIENETINLKNLCLLFSEIFKKYFNFFFLVIILYIIYFFVKSPVYSSNISFYANYSSQSQSSINFLQTLAGDLSDADLGFSISDFLNSENFSDDIINKTYNLNNTQITLVDYLSNQSNGLFYYFNPINVVNSINKKIQMSSHLSDRDKEVLLAKEYLKENLSYSENRKTQLHTVSFEATSEQLSQQIINNIFESIIQYANEVTNTKANEKRLFIEGRLVEISNNLELAENEMLIFLEKNKSISSPALQLQRTRIEKNITLYSQLYISLSDQLELAKIDEKDNTSPIVVLDSPNIAFYKPGRTLLTNIFLLLILLTILFSTIEIYQNRKYLLI